MASTAAAEAKNCSGPPHSANKPAAKKAAKAAAKRAAAQPQAHALSTASRLPLGAGSASGSDHAEPQDIKLFLAFLQNNPADASAAERVSFRGAFERFLAANP